MLSPSSQKQTADPGDYSLGGYGVIVYPSDKMGFSHLQSEFCRVTGGLFISYFASQGRMIRVGTEMNLIVRQGPPEPRVVVPDLYVLEDEPQSGPKVPSWNPAEHDGKVPTLAVEVVSDSYRKDYAPEEALSRYEELGVPEVLRYDPDWSAHRRAQYPRRLLTHFVRNGEGKLEAQPDIGRGDRVFLRRYKVWLIHHAPHVLRLATGTPDDLYIWPTDAERARTEGLRAEAEAGRAREAEERAQAEAERAREAEERALRAEERVRALEAELAAREK